jgi:hypothetical protein
VTICSERSMDHDPVQIGAEIQSGKKICSVLHFCTESVLNKRLSLKLMLTSNDTYLREEYYTNVVDNYDTFSACIYTSLSDKWSRSNDLRKSRVLLEIPVF